MWQGDPCLSFRLWLAKINTFQELKKVFCFDQHLAVEVGLTLPELLNRQLPMQKRRSGYNFSMNHFTLGLLKMR